MNNEKIALAIQKGQPITLKTNSLPPSVEDLLDEILDTILIKYSRADLKNALSVCMKEITGNAKKANLKRAFFKKNGLDIYSKNQYDEGMKNFKKQIMEQLEYYYKLLEELQLYIQITYQYSSEGVIITISNNCPITEKELIRIRERLSKAMSYDGADDALMDILDDTEGAGLGIVMIVLMLKREGINPNAFVISSAENLTVARLSIHFARIDEKKVSVLSDAIFSEITSLPAFPENIARLRELLNSDEANMSQVAMTIKRDPSLSADLLKLTNSAQFMLPRKISSIDEAVKIVGFRGLRNIIASYGAKKILESKYGKMEDIWEHSYRCAFYAYEIGRNRSLEPSVIEDVFLGGLLHDLGKIITFALHPQLIDKIKKICHEKQLKTEILEDLAFSVTHAKVGALLAEKWNFPERLVKVIEFHHDPLFADNTNKDAVFTVYFANALCQLEKGEIVIEAFNKSVLEYFNIKDDDGILKLSARLQQLYKLKCENFT